jgi:hypothetical protein
LPDLAWRLPRPRKPWESEPRRMSVFDAAAIGLAYWQHETSLAPTPRARTVEEDQLE